MTIVEAASGKTPEPVFDPVVDYIALCMNSFSTPPGGITAPLVYVGAGTSAANYEAVDVKGAVVLADGPMRSVWAQAVRQRGAAGLISATPPAPDARPDDSPISSTGAGSRTTKPRRPSASTRAVAWPTA